MSCKSPRLRMSMDRHMEGVLADVAPQRTDVLHAVQYFHGPKARENRSRHIPLQIQPVALLRFIGYGL
ncbi:hypothetical protein SLA2020_374620 [Shorea laevis]